MSTCSIPGCERFTGVHKRCWEHVGTFARGEVAPVFDLVSREWSPAEQTAEATSLRTLRAPVPAMDRVCAHGAARWFDCPECVNAADFDPGWGAHR